jgi:5-methylcytosine-specific restriction endonuclease McrA
MRPKHMSKYCGGCGTTQPSVMFDNDRDEKDGLTTMCAACDRAYSQAYRLSEKNRTPVPLTAHELQVLAAEKLARDNEIKHRRRARKLANGVNLVKATEMVAIAARPCTACAAPAPSTVDHVIPIARGGPHSIGNLMPLCRSCNSSKHDMLWIEWKYSNRPQAVLAFAS